MPRAILLRALLGLIATAAIAVPATVSASAFVITIEGVDTSASAIAAVEAEIAAAIAINPGAARPVLAGMYLPLGNCNPLAGFLNSCDPLGPPVATNPLKTALQVAEHNAEHGTNFSSAAIYGYGLAVDQLILHRFESTFDITGGIATPPPAFAQTFDFIVGSTGGGSAGPYPGPFNYDIDLVRNVRITGVDGGGNVIDITQAVHQLARLSVGWEEDTMMIFQSEAVTFDLGASGRFDVRLRAEGPIVAGDPAIGGEIYPSGADIPEPSTLALLGLSLGLVAFGRRRVPARP